MKFFKILLVAGLLMASLRLNAQSISASIHNPSPRAQSISIEYQTELQTDFGTGLNNIHLLRLDADIPIGKVFRIEAATLTIAKTRQERILDDLQVFSNIEEDTRWLALAVAGISLQLGDNHTLAMGIRNLNEDYFTSPVTSLFTQSSCGIYPTISTIGEVANYPLSDLGIHYRFERERYAIQASVYTGTGDMGRLAIAQSEYRHKGSMYFLGACLYDDKARTSSAVWSYCELALSSSAHLLAGYSHAFNTHTCNYHEYNTPACSDYICLGGAYNLRNLEFGFAVNYAKFNFALNLASAPSDIQHELATEFTCKATLSPHFSLQASVHLISDTHQLSPIGLIRLCIK